VGSARPTMLRRLAISYYMKRRRDQGARATIIPGQRGSRTVHRCRAIAPNSHTPKQAPDRAAGRGLTLAGFLYYTHNITKTAAMRGWASCER
ncbi:MAG: hypothetical protein WA803_22460, partial [Steroidobacteraceae bacterium]